MKTVTICPEKRICTKCHGTGTTLVKPVIYEDIFGNSYPSTLYSLGFSSLFQSVLPDRIFKHKEETCSSCNGTRVEYFI